MTKSLSIIFIDLQAGKASTIYLHKGKTAYVKVITSTDEKKKLVLKDKATHLYF